MWIALVLNLLLSLAPATLAQYQLAQEYAGAAFFDRWDFFGSYDNLTNGDVVFQDRANATAQRLAYVDAAGHAILRVDNTSIVPWNEKRNSVRIESVDAYSIGSLFIIDVNHLPYGCSVWPAFWSVGDNWPAGGEIDIIEQINFAKQNQMALHTDTGCFKRAGAAQTGVDGDGDCSTPKGCTVVDPSHASFGAPFAAAGGGVWATQFDSSGIFIWFWSRANVPSMLAASTAPATINTSAWGVPTAEFPADDCAIESFFGPQRLVLTITLCGDWAGAPAVYNASSCYTSAGPVCYLDNVIDEGSPKYDTAYFDISHIRTYTLPGMAVSSVAPSATGTATNAGAAVTQLAGSASRGRTQPAAGWVAAGAVAVVAGAMAWL